MDSMIGHTPGPWSASHHGDSLIVVSKTGWITGQIGQPQKNANACLIAAAPDLLNALQESLFYLKDRAPKQFTMAKAAIVKAQGTHV